MGSRFQQHWAWVVLTALLVCASEDPKCSLPAEGTPKIDLRPLGLRPQAVDVYQAQTDAQSQTSLTPRGCVVSDTPRTAIVTIVSNDNYAAGAIVLAKSLRTAGGVRLPHEVGEGEAYEMVCMIPDLIPDASSVSDQMRGVLAMVGWHALDVKQGEATRSNEYAEHARTSANGQERAWGAAALKLHLWGMVDYDRVLYIDADTIVLKPLRPLFQSKSFWKRNFSAIYEVATDSRIFKSGLLAVRPAAEVASELMRPESLSEFTHDQQYLNWFFREEWLGKAKSERIPQKWHVGASYCVASEKKQAKQFQSLLKSRIVFDFQGVRKPWNWPATILVPSCVVNTQYVYLWTALLYAHDWEAVHSALNGFTHENDNRPLVHAATGNAVVAVFDVVDTVEDAAWAETGDQYVDIGTPPVDLPDQDHRLTSSRQKDLLITAEFLDLVSSIVPPQFAIRTVKDISQVP